MACCSPETTVSSPAPSLAAGSRPALPAAFAEHAAKVLALECPDRTVHSGFHVTEIKLASIASLDCGRGRDRWQEIIIQVMDAPGSTDTPLTAGKFAAIVAEALEKTDSAGATITIELSDGTEALRLYDMAAAYAREDAFVIRLQPRTARCKAAGRVPGSTTPEVTSRCCG